MTPDIAGGRLNLNQFSNGFFKPEGYEEDIHVTVEGNVTFAHAGLHILCSSRNLVRVGRYCSQSF